MRADFWLYAFSVRFCKFNGDKGKDKGDRAVRRRGQWYSGMDIPFSSTAIQSVGIPKSWSSVRKGERSKGNYLNPLVQLLP